VSGEVATAIITGLASVLVAVVTVPLPRLLRQGKHLAEVKEQVANAHGTNLRDDLDFIRDLVLELKTDVSWVRREQLDQAHRLALLEDPCLTTS